MKKLGAMESTCICGHEVPFKFKKPKPFQPTVVKAVCPGCQSRYLITIALTGEIKFLGAEVSGFAQENFSSWREQL